MNAMSANERIAKSYAATHKPSSKRAQTSANSKIARPRTNPSVNGEKTSTNVAQTQATRQNLHQTRSHPHQHSAMQTNAHAPRPT
jgi:hypothetical protein